MLWYNSIAMEWQKSVKMTFFIKTYFLEVKSLLTEKKHYEHVSCHLGSYLAILLTHSQYRFGPVPTISKQWPISRGTELFTKMTNCWIKEPLIHRNRCHSLRFTPLLQHKQVNSDEMCDLNQQKMTIYSTIKVMSFMEYHRVVTFAEL